MIESKLVDLYARSSGLRDKLIAERDIVLTYALRALLDTGVMKHLAFKGGTCLRKLVFGSTGRFSEDLDFTLDTRADRDETLTRLIEVLQGTYHGITFACDDFYLTDGDTSFGGDVRYRHAWNSAGHFRLQVSLREEPTLPVTARSLKSQGYFAHLEFEPFAVRSLDTIEMIAEKLRAAFQRAKVRDLYDLHRFASLPFDGQLLRRLAVLKLAQVRDPFDPEVFFKRLRSGKYDWDDLRRLMRTSESLRAEEVIAAIETRFAFLHELSLLERQVIEQARSGRGEALIERLRREVLDLTGATGR